MPMSLAESDENASQAPADEGRLLSAVKEGDRSAAEALVERTYTAVYASLFRLCGGDADLASDLTQETYQKAWEAIARFEGRSKLFTWLYRIAYTTFINSIRRPNRTVPLDEPAAKRLQNHEQPADERLRKTEEAESVRRALLGLSEDLRFTVTAHFWADLPVREIARIEGISTVAIRKRLYRAYSLLEAAIEEETS